MRPGAKGPWTILATVAIVLSIMLTACGTAAPAPTPAPTAKSAPASTPAPAATSAAKPAEEKPAATTAAAKPAQVTKMTVPLDSVSASFWPLYVMQQKGFDKEQSIELDLPLMKSEQIEAALVSKSVDMIFVSGDRVVRAVELGENLVVVGGVVKQATHSLVARPGIKSVEELKGKKIAVNTVVGGNAEILKRMLASKGLKKGDYDLIVAGGTTERYSALKAGGVDAAMLIQPTDFQAVEEGFPAIMFAPDAVKDWALDSATIRRDWVKETANEELLIRFLSALAKSCAWLHDPKNKQEAVQILVKISKIDERLVTDTYDLYFNRYDAISKEGEPTMAGMKMAIDITNDVGDVFKGPLPAPEKYVDVSYWEKAVGHKYQ